MRNTKEVLAQRRQPIAMSIFSHCLHSQPPCQRYNPFVSYSAGLKIAFFLHIHAIWRVFYVWQNPKQLPIVSEYQTQNKWWLCAKIRTKEIELKEKPICTIFINPKDTYSTQYTLLPQHKNKKYFTWPMALPDINCECYGWLLLTFCLRHYIQNVHNFLSKIQVNHPSAA